MFWAKDANNKWIRSPYKNKVPDSVNISKYVKDFPVKVELQKGTKVAVQAACKKYLGKSYLYMMSNKIHVRTNSTWLYHNGILYLKNPSDESIVTMALLAKR